MKTILQRQAFSLLSMLLFLTSSCEENLPVAATIVTGQVIDENGLPLEGAGLRLTGVDNKGWSGVPTFSLTAETDKDGMYKFSQVIPTDTDVVSILPRSTQKVKYDTEYDAVILIDGNYIQLTSPYSIPCYDWGKTTILNYQFRKL